MQKKLLITVLTLLLIIVLTFTVQVQLVDASAVIFNMDTLPENQGWTISKNGNVTSSVSNGILTIENNGGSLNYYAPADWNNTVNNTKGWIVEFKMRLEPLSNYHESQFAFYVSILDKQYGTTIGFSGSSIAYYTPVIGSSHRYFMNTTDNFHVYRIVVQENILRVFVDEKLVLNVPGMRFLPSGYINIQTTPAFTRSYWDYFSYDTNPNITLASPTLTVVDGIASYYISNLTGVTVDNSLIVIPNGIYAGWCVDKSTVMVRNEAHNIILYSNTQYSSLFQEQYDWSSVNYILNHKQGSMKEIQDAIWYFVPDQTSPPLNETNTWSMINIAKANPNYIPGKGEIMAIIAHNGRPIPSFLPGPSGVQNTILEYRIP